MTFVSFSSHLLKRFMCTFIATSIATGTQQARENLQQQLQQQLTGATTAVTTATTTIRTINIVQQAPQISQVHVQRQQQVVQQTPAQVTTVKVRPPVRTLTGLLKKHDQRNKYFSQDKC